MSSSMWSYYSDTEESSCGLTDVEPFEPSREHGTTQNFLRQRVQDLADEGGLLRKRLAKIKGTKGATAAAPVALPAQANAGFLARRAMELQRENHTLRVELFKLQGLDEELLNSELPLPLGRGQNVGATMSTASVVEPHERVGATFSEASSAAEPHEDGDVSRCVHFTVSACPSTTSSVDSSCWNSRVMHLGSEESVMEAATSYVRGFDEDWQAVLGDVASSTSGSRSRRQSRRISFVPAEPGIKEEEGSEQCSPSQSRRLEEYSSSGPPPPQEDIAWMLKMAPEDQARLLEHFERQEQEVVYLRSVVETYEDRLIGPGGAPPEEAAATLHAAPPPNGGPAEMQAAPINESQPSQKM